MYIYIYIYEALPRFFLCVDVSSHPAQSMTCLLLDDNGTGVFLDKGEEACCTTFSDNAAGDKSVGEREESIGERQRQCISLAFESQHAQV